MTAVVKLDAPRRSILAEMAEFYGMDAKMFEITLRKVAMPAPHSDEEFAACCIVAHQHKLNPITREIYFMRARGGGIQAIVGVDGWIKKCNEHPAFNGLSFEDMHDAKGTLTAIKCIIHRKDREHPIIVTEYLAECQRDTPIWKQMRARMLRHRSLIQGARVAFGFAGIMDPDEFEHWQERFRGETIAPRAATIPQLSELPDIPEPATEQPSAATVATEETQTVAGTRTDAEFQELFASALATAKDMDALTEHLMMNEDEIAERGLQQWARDQYEERKARLY